MEGRKKNMEGMKGTERERVIRHDRQIIYREREGERERGRETETEGWKAERRIWKGGGVQGERELYGMTDK